MACGHRILLSHLLLILSWVDIETKAVSIKIQLVLATRLLQDLGDVASVFNLPEMDITSALLDGFTDKLCRPSLTLSADNGSLLFLAGSVDDEGRTLSFLLSHLFGFNGSRKLWRESKVR